MRYLLVVLILAGTGVGLWYTLEAGPAGGPQELAAAPAMPAPGRKADGPVARSAEPFELAAPGPAPLANTTQAPATASAQGAAGRTALEGTVTDRFGKPVPKERIFLLSAAQAHPAAGTDLSDYVTAITAKSGKFSLSTPGPGPWRIGIGPPGAPRIPPSAAHAVTGTAHARVILPGATVLRVAFDELPEGDSPVALELLQLVEPGAGGPEGTTGDRAGRGGARGQRNQRNQRGQGVQRGQRGQGGQGVRRGQRPTGSPPAPTGARPAGGKGTGNSGDARAPLATPPQLHASVPQDAPGTPRLGGNNARRGRRNSGEGNKSGQDASPQEQKEPVVQLGPPPEVWRARRRQPLSAAERTAGLIEISGLPAGPVSRLVVVLGEERLEGATRFTLQPDVVTEVRVFPLQTGSGSASYVVTPKPLPAGEARPGVEWDD